ncbi:hypothetical protein RKD37_001565 [Streptomyces ambofaciens]
MSTTTPSGRSTGRISSSKWPFFRGLGGEAVAAQGERVLTLARDAVPLGDLLGRLPHGEQSVQVLHGRVDQAPAEPGVGGLDAVRQRLVGAGQHEGGAAHGLGAAGQHDVGLARGDGAGGGGDGFEAGGAEPVDGGAGHGLGQAREQGGHAGDVAVVLARLVGGAPVHVVDPGGVQRGHVGDQAPDHGGGEVVGPHGGQRAAQLADRGAAGGREVDGTHEGTPDRRSAVGGRRTAASTTANLDEHYP